MNISQQRIFFFVKVLVYCGYLLGGAAIFQAIEEEKLLFKLKKLDNLRAQIFWKYNISQLTQEEEITLSSYYLESYATMYGKWSFGNAVLFCMTSLTTIGYGNMVPRLAEGRIFFIVYTLIGIPATCLLLKSIGEQIAWLISVIIKNFEKKCLGRENPWKVKLKTTAATVILTLLVVLPLLTATIKTRRKDMTYLECFYFTFVSLSTIGFGDFVLHFNGAADYLLLVEMFLGLSCVSSILCSLNLWIERHADKGQQLLINKALRTGSSTKNTIQSSNSEDAVHSATNDQGKQNGQKATLAAEAKDKKETLTVVQFELENSGSDKTSVATQTEFVEDHK